MSRFPLCDHPRNSGCCLAIALAWLAHGCGSDGQRLSHEDHRPAFASPEAERVEGTLDVMIHDDVDGTVDEHHFVELAPHDRLRLAFASDAARDRYASAGAGQTLTTGARVRLWGQQLDTQFLVEQLEVVAPGGLGDVDPVEVGRVEKARRGRQPIGLGDHSVAVVLVGFQGTPNNFDVEQMRQSVYGTGRSTNTFYLAGSFGGSKLVGVENVEGGDVFGPYTVSSSGCANGYDAAGTEARDMAQNEGHDMDAYEKVVHYLPPNAPDCPGGGVGGGRYAFIFGIGINGAWDYIAHEVAHTFGLPHAGSFTNCTSGGDLVTYTGNCGRDEYGDLTDIMGGRNFQFSSHHLERLGWLPADATVTLEQSARVRLEPIETASTGVQSLYVNRSGNEDFHFEYRQPRNVDERLEAELTDGVLIRIVNGGATTRLLDMTPDNSFRDATLRLGRTFSDSGVEVTVVEVTPEAAIIEVTIDGDPLDPPTVVGGDGAPATEPGADGTDVPDGADMPGDESPEGDPEPTGDEEDGTDGATGVPAEPDDDGATFDVGTGIGDDSSSTASDTGSADEAAGVEAGDESTDSLAIRGGSDMSGLEGGLGVAGPTASARDGGCSVSAPGTPRAPAGPWVALLALGMLLRRREGGGGAA